MFSASEFLEVIKSASTKVPREQMAKDSIPKRELFFRDFVLGHLAASDLEISVTKEWRLPKSALEQWVKRLPEGVNKKLARVDLVGFSSPSKSSINPDFGVEFKFWYWFDALDDGKYKVEDIEYKHSIPLSFSVDKQKLLAAIPADTGTSLIVTVVPTIHFDLIPQGHKTSRGEFLIDRGFPSSYIRLSKVNNSEQPHSSDELRAMALKKISEYFRNAGYPTVAGGELTGEYKGLHVTTDFVVSEVSTPT